MGIGRKEFIKLMGLALTGVAIGPFQSVVTVQDHYLNRKLGILFQKPTDWGFIHLKDFGKMKKSQILLDDWEPEKEKVWQGMGDPACVITKYFEDTPELTGIFSPTITLNINHRSGY